MLQSTKDDRRGADGHDANCLWKRQVVVAVVSSVWLLARGFLAFECAKPFKICTCMRELDTVKHQVPNYRFWTSLQLYRLRIPESSHSLAIGHPPDLCPALPHRREVSA